MAKEIEKAPLITRLEALGRSRVVPVLIVVCLSAVAYLLRWDQDDAFISYRYAENWARGWGPVWNEGYAVEGYTNFLWVALLALADVLGFDVVQASLILSVCSYAVFLFVVDRLAKSLFNPVWALIALLLIGTNYSVLCYATGGLETALNAALVSLLLVRGVDMLRDKAVPKYRQLVLTSVTSILAVMTRPDAIVAVAVIWSFTALQVWRRREDCQPLGLAALSLVGPALVLAVPWLFFKLQFYGGIAPNTYLVKMGVSSGATWLRGAVYVGLFFATYWLWPALGLLLLRPRGVFRGSWRLLAIFVVLWLFYVVRSGGDIMEYRQMVPVVAPLVLLALFGIQRARMKPLWRTAFCLVLPLGNVTHALFFPGYVPVAGIGTVRGLEAQVARDLPENWTAIGQVLARVFHSGDRPVIAVSPAGAIPYYSRLTSIDVLGLNDLWVARHGVLRTGCRACAAHPRLATFEYLRSAGVSLVIAHPIVVSDIQVDPASLIRRMFYDEPVMDYESLADERLVFLPLAEHSFLAMLQLKPHPAVDALVLAGGMKSLPISNFSPAQH